jgi:hypothetical protein
MPLPNGFHSPQPLRHRAKGLFVEFWKSSSGNQALEIKLWKSGSGNQGKSRVDSSRKSSSKTGRNVK